MSVCKLITSVSRSTSVSGSTSVPRSQVECDNLPIREDYQLLMRRDGDNGCLDLRACPERKQQQIQCDKIDECGKVCYWQLNLHRDEMRYGRPRYMCGSSVDIAAYSETFAIFSIVVKVTKLGDITDDIRATVPTVDALYRAELKRLRSLALDRLFEQEAWAWEVGVVLVRESEQKAREVVAAQERERMMAMERKKREEARYEAERVAMAKRRADEELQIQRRKEAEAAAAQVEAKHLADAKVLREAYEAQRRAQEQKRLRYVNISSSERITYEMQHEADENEQRRLWEVRTRQTHHEREYETWRYRMLHEPEAYASHKKKLESLPAFGTNVARVVRVLSCTPLPPSNLVCVTVTTERISDADADAPESSSRMLSNPTSLGQLPCMSIFTIEPNDVYRVDDRAILFAHPSRDFYLPDIPETLQIPDQKVPASFTHVCSVTKRTTMGKLVPLSWIYNNQPYFFGFPGQAILDTLKQSISIASDTALLVCVYLGRREFVVGEDVTPIMRLQAIPHHRPPVFKPCDCYICHTPST